MATSSTMRSPGWSDGLTMAAQDIRLVDISALLSGAGGSSTNQLAVASGVRPGANGPLKVAAATGLSVTVNPGFALVQGSAAANQGTYATCLDASATLTCQTADSVNDRIDSVCVTVTDNGNATSNAVVQIVTGTPAGSPSAPALPANSVRLGDVRVPANATSLSAGNVADKRTYAAAAGGIKLVQSSTFYPTAGQGVPGDFYFDMALGRLLVFNGTTLVAPSTALFAPAVAGPATVTVSSTVFVTIVSANVTTDGNTPVKVSLSFKYISTAGTSAGVACTVVCTRDGGMVGDGFVKTCTGPDSNIDGGSSWVEETPPAGTHTYVWEFQNQGSGTFQIHSARMLIEAMSP